MRVPLLDLSEQYRALSEEIRAATDEVLASHRFTLGPKLAEFEKAIAEYCHVSHAVGVSSGTDALLAVLMALEIGLGDAVITTAYSFFATGGCISRVGATPVFIDIDPETYNISASALKRYIDKYCHRVEGKLVNENRQTICALVPVHLFGLCCEMNEMLAVAREHDLLLIEDAGLVVCRNEQFADRLRICRQHGMEACYRHRFIGGNFRLDELQAAILNVKLPHLDRWSAARRDAAKFYTNEFRRVGLDEKLKLPVEPYMESKLANHHIYHQYVIRSPRRDELREHLTGREIETAIYYPLALHEQPCFEYLGYIPGDFPEAERAARESLALPIYPEISREAQQYVVKCAAEFFE